MNYTSGDAILNRFNAMVEVSIDRPIPGVAWVALWRRATVARDLATNPVVVAELDNVIIESWRCVQDSLMLGI